MQVYSQICNSSYAFWGGNATLNYTSPVRCAVSRGKGGMHHDIPCLLSFVRALI